MKRGMKNNKAKLTSKDKLIPKDRKVREFVEKGGYEGSDKVFNQILKKLFAPVKQSKK